MGRSFFLATALTGLLLPGTGCGESKSGACPIEECYRLIRCVEECGGPVIQSSCCACPEGSFDAVSCSPEGAG